MVDSRTSKFLLFLTLCLLSCGLISSPLLAGSLYLTGHDVLLHGGQNGYAKVILDCLRGAGTSDEIPAASYDIALLRSPLGGAIVPMGFGTVTVFDPSAIASNDAAWADVFSHDVVVVASHESCGGCSIDDADVTAMAARRDEFVDFFNAGGDIWANSGANSAEYYDFLPPALLSTASAISGSTGFSATPEGVAIGITDSMINGFPTHNRFVDFSPALTIFEVRGDEVVSLGIHDGELDEPPTVDVPWDFYVCPTDERIKPPVTVCNRSASPRSYTFGFRGVPAGEHRSCQVDGPTTFQPQGLPDPFVIPPDGCRTLIVETTLPPGLACWEVTVTENETGFEVKDLGTFPADPNLCCRTPDPVVAVSGGEPTNVVFDVTALGSPTTLDYTVQAFGPGMTEQDIFVLDGQPPGLPATGSVDLQPGVTARISVDVSWTTLDPEFYDLLLQADLDEDGTLDPLASVSLLPTEVSCVQGLEGLCLTEDRFKVEVSWTDFQGGTGVGQAVPLTTDTGYFWFFNANNVELVLKVLDARDMPMGQAPGFWVFYGSLSNVEYTITVTDLATNRVKEYVNPPGQFASVGDTQAFPEVEGLKIPATAPLRDVSIPMQVDREAFGTGTGVLDSGATGTCTPDATHLCLTEDRFRVSVEWEDFQGNTGVGQAIPITTDTGYFWFFDDANVELVLKVLDGRVINNNFWVFYGALSNVEYTITVTDTVTGNEKQYNNPSGNFGSVGDTAAF